MSPTGLSMLLPRAVLLALHPALLPALTLTLTLSPTLLAFAHCDSSTPQSLASSMWLVSLAPFCYLNCRSISLSAFWGRRVASFTPRITCERAVLSRSLRFLVLSHRRFIYCSLPVVGAVLPSNLIAVNIIFDIRKSTFRLCTQPATKQKERERHRER